MTQKNLKIQQSITGRKQSKRKRYQELVIGSDRLSELLLFELIMTSVSWIPGALGIFLRSKLYPLILGHVGRGTVFGTNVVFRHPKKIHIGEQVIIDDNVMLDAKGTDNDGIRIEDEAYVGRNSILSCKGGNITLAERVNIGFNCDIFSSNRVYIGKDTLLAAYCYLVGGGSYHLERKDIPINQQVDFAGKGGITLQENIWLGAHAVILDGVTIGNGSVVAAGAVVTKDVSEMVIVAGTPAKELRQR
ncbi:MAG: acyltransferase [Desulfobulbaceae bacterium]|nr:MAG: acyltransferase [Desulfobulbaceae bacterium]